MVIKQILTYLVLPSRQSFPIEFPLRVIPTSNHLTKHTSPINNTPSPVLVSNTHHDD